MLLNMMLYYVRYCGLLFVSYVAIKFGDLKKNKPQGNRGHRATYGGSGRPFGPVVLRAIVFG